MAEGLQIKVQASNDYLRIDKYTNGKGVRFTEQIASNKILQRQAKEIADLIRLSIEENLIKGKRFDTGGKVAKLKASTIKRKGHSRVFDDTGLLLRSVKVKKLGRGYLIFIGGKRAEIMKYLQEGSPKMAARPAFGINKTKLQQIIKDVIGKTKKLK
jgi:hypothetical protein